MNVLIVFLLGGPQPRLLHFGKIKGNHHKTTRNSCKIII